MQLILKGAGWACITLGTVVALYLVYSLYWTGRQTNRAQALLLDEWELSVGDLDAPAAGSPPATSPGTPPPVDLGDGIAALQFHRPGADAAPVHADPLFIVEGVTDDVLRSGPGHYPGTAGPGEMGNFAVAGHRTTYGAPFYDLETIEVGDEILVTDRNGTRWTYEVVDEQIVAPDRNDVLGRDPLGLGRPMLTLTTCHPRWSNAERLVVFAQLSDEQVDQVAA